MIVINFSHPLSADVVAKLEATSGKEVTLHDVPVQLNENSSFAEQVTTLLENLPLDENGWQTEPLIVNLPGLNHIAAVLLAQIHGRMGHFPTILRLARIPYSTPSVYAFQELIDLQAERDRAREGRFRQL